MKIKIFASGLLLSLLILINCDRGQSKMICQINSIEDLKKIFPKSVNEIQQNVEKVKNITLESVNEILAVPNDKRDFKNTAKAIDKIGEKTAALAHSIAALELVSSEKDIRDAAHKASIEMNEFHIKEVSTNKKLYEALKYYYDHQFKEENLNPEERYFVTESIQDLERMGLSLPEEKLAEVRKILQEISKLEQEFEQNINLDNSQIQVTEDELKGLPEQILNSLEKTADGKYILKPDYPTVNGVLDHVEIEKTREKVSRMFNNRAYPKNMEILKEILIKKNHLAKLLDYKDFAHLDMENEMAKSPENVTNFINNIVDKATRKAKKELKLFSESNRKFFDKNGKIQPWNIAFVKNEYKKKYLQLDEKELTKYFPLENTIKELLDIYQKFFNLEFKEIQTGGFWHQDVKIVEVFKDKHLISYLILDLHPRDNKYSHACDQPIIPAVKKDNKICPSVSLVIANFPKSTPNSPALLTYKDVTTFFHEFGHAMHDTLGRTELSSFSGTNVKSDFVELPSQMLENWMEDREILKKVSKHYQTGEPLSDDLIEKIVDLKKFDSGDFTLRQLQLALLSLGLFDSNPEKDIQELSKNMAQKLRDYILWDPESHFVASFGHLASSLYGPKYYGYMWSNVFAHDLFDTIKKSGLLNGNMGQKYIDNVIGRGGSQDPNELIEAFLGRKPSEEAFMKNMGFQ